MSILVKHEIRLTKNNFQQLLVTGDYCDFSLILLNGSSKEVPLYTDVLIKYTPLETITPPPKRLVAVPSLPHKCRGVAWFCIGVFVGAITVGVLSS